MKNALRTEKRLAAGVRAAFAESLEGLAEPATLLRDARRQRLLSQVDILTDTEEGTELLLEEMPRLVEADVFRDTVWAEPEVLVPTLATGTLRVGGETTLFEILSELRMLALSQGRIRYPRFSRARARDFIEQVIVNDLALFYGPAADGAPKGRAKAGRNGKPSVDDDAKATASAETEIAIDPAVRSKLGHLVTLFTRTFPLDAMKEVVAAEVELICAQRPVVTDRVLDMIRVLDGRIDLDPRREEDRRLLFFMDAVLSPSRASSGRGPGEYAAFLEAASADTLEGECRELSRRMRETGLAVGYHALLLRRVADDPRLLALALGVDAAGRAELVKHRDFVAELVREAIHPGTARASYGLSMLLNRGLLSHQPVRSRLGRFATLELHPEVAAHLAESDAAGAVPPRARLLADCLGILGQPLGVGQGGNPTCQSARGISLWSRHAPGKLLGMIETAATTNDLSMRYEGQAIRASDIAYEMAGGFDRNLDAVSLVLVPHLDRIYNEMMRRAAYRGEDPHKWVNPAMYGHWIPDGFLSAYDYATDSIRGYDTFLRTFYATHHPEYNGGHDLAYPNPVGIFLTSAGGALIGFHAVSIVRVRPKSGQMRVYFVNPNNEGRQQWQAEIRPTVAGNGERPGESSLPFRQFASRLYAFHFSPSEVGDPARVDAAELERVVAISKSSWGPSYRWTEEPKI